MSEYAMTWLAGQGQLASRTREKTRGHLTNHIVPTFGNYQIGAIHPEHVRVWFSELQLSAATANAVLGTLHRVLQTATRDGLIARNPCAHVDRRREQSHFSAQFLTPEQVQALADAIDPRYRALIHLAAYGGLRWGELAALRAGDIDFLGGVVHVQRSMETSGREPSFKMPKSGKSRSITIPRRLAQLLGEHIGQFGGCVDAVFTSSTGHYLDHSNWYPRHFRPAVKAANLPENLRFHDLRHTSVAIAIGLGAHPKQIQERLGHSTVRLTLDRYGHLFPALDGSLQAHLDEAFSRSLAASSRP